MRFLTEDEKTNLRLEYEVLRKNITERNHRLYLADSITIPASLLIIINTFQYRENLLSIGVPLFFMVLCFLFGLLYLHISAIEVNAKDYELINEIIEALGRSSFPSKKMYDQQLKGKLWFRTRKYVWPIVILILIVIDVLALLVFVEVI